MPKMGQQTGEGVRVGRRKHRRQAGQHIAEIHERIMTVPLAGGQQAEVDRRRPPAAVAPTKKPISSPKADATQGVLRRVVVYALKGTLNPRVQIPTGEVRPSRKHLGRSRR